MLTLPFSNAAVETVFSVMSIVKPNLRNRLICETVASIITVRYGLKLRGEKCSGMKISTEMMKCFNVSMYDLKTSDNDDNGTDYSNIELLKPYLLEI